MGNRTKTGSTSISAFSHLGTELTDLEISMRQQGSWGSLIVWPHGLLINHGLCSVKWAGQCCHRYKREGGEELFSAVVEVLDLATSDSSNSKCGASCLRIVFVAPQGYPKTAQYKRQCSVPKDLEELHNNGVIYVISAGLAAHHVNLRARWDWQSLGPRWVCFQFFLPWRCFHLPLPATSGKLSLTWSLLVVLTWI